VIGVSVAIGSWDAAAACSALAMRRGVADTDEMPAEYVKPKFGVNVSHSPAAIM